MKHQQVVPDYYNMFKSSCTCLLLAFSGYVLLKMIQAIFWLPGYLEKNQTKLEEMAKKYSIDLNEKVNNQNDEEKTQLPDNKSHILEKIDEDLIQAEDNSKPDIEISETKKIK